MKMLFLSHYFPPEGNAPATRTFEHTRRWVKEGHEVTVITCAPNVPHGKVYPGYRNHLFQWRKQSGVNILRVWTLIAANKGTTRRSLNYFSYLISALVAGLLVRKPDILIATSPQFFCGCAGALIAKLRRIPFVLEVRDIWPDSIMAVGAMYHSYTLRWMLRAEQWLYRSATQIVTVGNGYKNILLEKGVEKEKIKVITNGADLEQFKMQETTRERHQKLTCAYVGTIGMAACLDVVVRAATRLDQMSEKSIEFILVGDGANLEPLKELAARSKTERIQFKGLLSKKEVQLVLLEADVCLVHLKKTKLFMTVLPSKLFEAMASGVPILLGVQGEAEAIVRDSGCGLVFEPERDEELCNQLLQLKNNPLDRCQMGFRGRQFVEKHFDRNKLASLYINLLKQIIQS
ncbi:glycosyltransferase family 4 protein [Verrucomicrobia bacterium]|nr:glycosyltransferase family 4 protein [Verrucomicrobiota bacterium]MDB4664818.1 glycosyltransferase family 4 protein [Verrucomicrobiota bacterium]MDC0268169.1 glycosyltransferase family 4 protein [bacterium]MDG1889909.1 glycosyltransferase family 4 protein [Verrucomicrobiota bacterium]